MNRDRLLYEMTNINRNMRKIGMIISDLDKLSENDGLLANDVEAVIQINNLMEEAKNDTSNVRDSIDNLKELSEKSLNEMGYVREHKTYGKWIPVKDEEQQ